MTVSYNPYIVVPLATWAVSQVAKFALAAFRGRLDFRYLYASGGMPSVHSAIVVSLSTTAFLVDGPSSHLFGFTLIFAAIVMYDSFGVRRSTGEQAAAINLIMAGMERSKIRFDQPVARIREILGHQPEEVTIGAVVGLILGCVFNYSHLGVVGSFVEGIAGRTENIIYFGVSALLIIGSIITRIVMSRRKSPTLKRLSRQLLTAGQTVGWLSLIASVLIYEQASYLAWRLWIIVILGIGIIWFSSLMSHWRVTLPAALQAEEVAARKSKWLRFGRKKRN